jgi:hypothetical protein
MTVYSIWRVRPKVKDSVEYITEFTERASLQMQNVEKLIGGPKDKRVLAK